MADTQTSNTADTGCFASVNELRLEHLKLMERDEARDDRVNEENVAKIRSFVARTQATGAVLSDRIERREAQGILDYWSSTLVGIGGADLRTWSQPRIAEYQDAAKRGEKPADAERTKAELTRLDENARQLIRLSALARQWKTGARNDGYLLVGDALENSKVLKGQDKDVDDLIKASHDHEIAARQSRQQFLATVIAVLSLLTAGLVWKSHEVNKANSTLDKQAIELREKTIELNVREQKLSAWERLIDAQKERLDSRVRLINQNDQLSKDLDHYVSRLIPRTPANLQSHSLPILKTFDAGSDEVRLSAALDYSRRLRSNSRTPVEQLALVKAVVALTSEANFAALSPDGRHYLLFILSMVPVQLWLKPDWKDARSNLRQNLTQLQTAVDAKQIILEDKSKQYLDAVRSYIGPAK
jgi:hypothetical protein